MIQFNELRITPDGKRLIIDASVKDLSYFNNVYIDAVIIDTQNTFTLNGPSTNAIFKHEVSTAYSTVYSIPEEGNCSPVLDSEDNSTCFTGLEENGEKRVRLELDSNLLGESLTNNLFFIYVVAKGNPSSDTPCGMDNQYVMGVVADLYPYYRSIVGTLKEVENNCEIPKNFINSLLRFKALEISLKTGNYIQAIKYWNKFFVGIKNNFIDTHCKCHG